MNSKKRKITCFVLFIILVLQISAINFTASIYTEFCNNQERLSIIQTKEYETLINEIVRGQQKHMLSSLKQSWTKYIENNNNNNELVFTDEKPQWNSSKVEEILDILVAPIKVFGNNGGMIVYDSNTGEIFLDTTPIQRIKTNKDVSIFEDYNHANNKNKEDTQLTAEKFFITKRDSNSISDIVYMFNEPTNMHNESSNFYKYPLGSYNRQFIEMSVMPYETIGFNGQPMQLTVLSVVDEQDIFSSYESLINEELIAINKNKKIYEIVSMILVINVLCNMIGMLITLYAISYKFHDGEKGRD